MVAMADGTHCSTLPDLLRRAASLQPDRHALRNEGSYLTYGQLEAMSNQISRALREMGVSRGDRVGVLGHKSLRLVASIYGVMKSGAAYVPINPEAPNSHVERIIDDCRITHLVSDERQMGRLTNPDTRQLPGIGWESRAAVSWDEVAELPDSPLTVELDEDDLAYIFYTSGSTGEPKGIMHSHGSALAFAVTAAEIYELTPDDRLTNHAPLHFDLSTFDLFSAAYACATTVIVPLSHSRLPASLSRLLEAESISVLYSVPFAQIQLLQRGALEERDLSSLRWVLFAGEAFPTKDLRALMAALPRARFSNIYGPTETNGCTYYHVDELPEDDSEPIPIGYPLPGTEVLIVDHHDRPVANGQVGELLVHGPTQMAGYWNRPDLSDRSTHLRRDGRGETRFYRTGDLASERSDGLLSLAGRKDRQIKTRGYRVELDEVEAALLSHPSIREAAVYPVPDGQGSLEIEAAVTIEDDIGSAELNHHLSSLLPRYAIPRSIRLLEAVPRTSTGKIDRQALQSTTTAHGEPS